MSDRKRDFTPARTLLPTLLAKLARESGRPGGLKPLWEDVAGPQIAAAVPPLRVEQGTLVVAAPDASWMKRIAEHASEIGERLSKQTNGQLSRVVAELSR